MRLLDRYLVREIVPPFLIALLVFTFILVIPFIIDLAESLIAKGVPWPTLLQLMVTLLPQALGLTIPMALLIGILVALGRLSGDRELTVMMACGISPWRLLRPVGALAVAGWAATSWVLIEAIPDANQTFREITMRVVADRAEGEVRPRVFFEDFPNTVLYVRELPPEGGWRDVLAADTSNPAQPIVYLAERGRVIVDREARTIQMVLERGTRHAANLQEPSVYEVTRFESLVMSLDPESVFPRQGPARGDREMTVAELEARIADLEAQGLPTHNQEMLIQQKFSIPVACLVFAVLALALGLTERKDGKLASFVLGIGIIFAYYVVMFGSQSMAKGGQVPPWLAMWLPNILLGGAGVALLMGRTRRVDRGFRLTLPAVRVPAWIRRTTERVGGSVTTEAPAAAATTGPRRAGARSKGRVVVVIRVPQFQLPRPNLLDLYVGRLYVRVLLMAVAGLTGLFYLSTFIDRSDKWFKGEVPLSMILEYLFWATPQFMSYILAIAVLLSALVTIGLLTRSSELIVMRACGISLYRTALPLVVFALLASTTLYGMEEGILPAANRRADRLLHLLRGGSPQTFDVLNRKWIAGREGDIYHYQYYDPRKQELAGLSILEFDAERFALARRTYATHATAVRDEAAPDAAARWHARGGWVRDFSRGWDIRRYTPFDEDHLAMEPPDYFVTEAPEPRRMTFDELAGYIDELKASGYSVLEHQVALQRKLAFPLVTLVMTLIAVPFAITTGKRGAMYGIGVGIVLALVYWTMISVFAAIGAAGLVHPTLAAWAPNLLFGAAAAYLLLTVRT